MTCRYIPFERYNPYFKTGMNRSLMESVRECGKPVVFLAGWDRKTVNVGRSQEIRKRVNLERAEKDDITVVRRQGGGGTTFLTPEGELTWGVVAPDEQFAEDVNEIYSNRCQVIADALGDLGIEAEHEPVNDVVTDQGKISGATLRRKGGVTYFGGTLLYDVNPEEMFRYIKPGEDKKKDKRIEDYRDRVSSVKKESDASFEETKKALREALLEDRDWKESELSEEEIERAEELANKYREDEWLYRE